MYRNKSSNSHPHISSQSRSQQRPPLHPLLRRWAAGFEALDLCGGRIRMNVKQTQRKSGVRSTCVRRYGHECIWWFLATFGQALWPLSQYSGSSWKCVRTVRRRRPTASQSKSSSNFPPKIEIGRDQDKAGGFPRVHAILPYGSPRLWRYWGYLALSISPPLDWLPPVREETCFASHIFWSLLRLWSA